MCQLRISSAYPLKLALLYFTPHVRVDSKPMCGPYEMSYHASNVTVKLAICSLILVPLRSAVAFETLFLKMYKYDAKLMYPNVSNKI